MNWAIGTLLGCVLATANARAAELCLYRDANGRIVQVNERSAVPEELRAKAQCFEARERAPAREPEPSSHPQSVVSEGRSMKPAPSGRSTGSGSDYLALPDQVSLQGTVRREDMASSLGRIQLRWPRKVEVLFGRTPQRAMSEAATTVSRVLRTKGFPPDLARVDLEWNVVFLDEDLPETQIPSSLISNCHPAWMTPPANLYVVSQRVVAGCMGKASAATAVNDAALAHILIHEIGHAVEYLILGSAFTPDRERAEGFASWFEQYASEFSAIIPKGSVAAQYRRLALESFAPGKTHQFNGSAHDYAVASMIFHAVVEKRGVRGLMEVYDLMKAKPLTLRGAIEARLGWDSRELDNEISRMIGGTSSRGR